MYSTNSHEVAAALERLTRRVQSPQALVFTPADRTALLKAADRAASQLLGETESVLTIALVGCGGAGKSTLINALAGAPISQVAEERPCTSRVHVYHHEDVSRGGLPQVLADRAAFVSHNRPELRFKVIVDTPDLDTLATQNRAATKALLKTAGLVIYVFSPERYLEERVWSVIREERRFSATIAVLNKVNTISGQGAEHIVSDIRRRFSEIGLPEIRVLRVCATCHAPDHQGKLHDVPHMKVDEFACLRAYIEHELQAGDVAQMVRDQRTRVVDHVQETVDRIVPRNLPARLDALERTAEERASAAGNRLADDLNERLATVEEQLLPVVALRRQQLFFGPLRAWISLSDFLHYGLPRFVRRLRLLGGGPSFDSDVERLLVTGLAGRGDDLLKSESGALQDQCFHAGLPVGRWQQVAAGSQGSDLLRRIASEIQARFEVVVADAAGLKRRAWWLSVLGLLMPGTLVIFAFVQILRTLATMDLVHGYGMLGLLFSGVLLCLLLLQGAAAGLVSVRRLTGNTAQTRQCVFDGVHQTILGWVRAYRSDLDADLVALHQPVETLRAALDGPDASRTGTDAAHRLSSFPVFGDQP